MYEIEKGIPVPPNSERATKYPWKMAIGESFFVPFGEDEHALTTQRVRRSAAMAGPRYNKKFTVREVDGGLRVWCIE